MINIDKNIVINYKSKYLSVMKPIVEKIIERKIKEVTDEKRNKIEIIKENLDMFLIGEISEIINSIKEKEKLKFLKEYIEIEILKELRNRPLYMFGANKSVQEKKDKINKKLEKFKISKIELSSKTNKELEEEIKLILEKLEKSIYEELNKIFDYDNNLTDELRHKIMTMLNVDVCPYCNRQYVNKYNEKSKEKTTADLDHFIPKKKYPFMGLNLFNFIPSCQICNQRFKKEKDPLVNNIIYPYDEEFGDDAKFTIELKGEEVKEEYNVDVLLGMSDDFKIDFDIKEEKPKLKEKIENSIETFKLDKMYSQNHKDYVRELIKKAIIYNESRITELYSQYGELFDSREEVVNMIVSNYISEEEIGKRPLGKLTRDICEELGIDIK